MPQLLVSTPYDQTRFHLNSVIVSSLTILTPPYWKMLFILSLNMVTTDGCDYWFDNWHVVACSCMLVTLLFLLSLSLGYHLHLRC